MFLQLGAYFHWHLTLFIIYSLFMLYACLVFFSGLNADWKDRHVTLSWINIIALVIFIIVDVVICVVLALFAADHLTLASVSYNILGPFLHIVVIVLWASLVHYVTKLAYSNASICLKLFAVSTYAIAFVALCSVPFLLSCPCISNNSTDLIKPKLIGHRGAPRLAPENTIMSFQKAIECSVFSLETDVHISMDGVPFLMHDDTLLRTTDVASQFPSRKDQRSDSFLWAEIQQLNAGKWFVDTNPNLSNQYLSSFEKIEASNQRVPSFEEYVQIAKQNNKSIYFDLLRPPSDHPHRDDWVNITIETILNTGINQEQVLWLYSDYSSPIVNELAPNFTVLSPSFNNNASQFGIQGVSAFYFETMYTDIRNAGKVISYVIREDWMLSWAWCQGVWAVITNRPCELNEISSPLYTMTQTNYIVMWVIIELLAIIAIVIYVWKCKQFIHPESDDASTVVIELSQRSLPRIY